MNNARHNLSVRYVRFSGEQRLMRDRWYTIDEVAAMFRVTRRSVARWLASGELVAYKLGKSGIVRVKGSAVMSFLQPVKRQPVKRNAPARTNKESRLKMVGSRTDGKDAD